MAVSDSMQETMVSMLPEVVRYLGKQGLQICVVRNHRPTPQICDSGRVDQLEHMALENPGCSWGVPIGKDHDLLVVTTKDERARKVFENYFEPDQPPLSRYLADFDLNTFTMGRNDARHSLYRWRVNFPNNIGTGVKVIKRGHIEILPDGKVFLVGPAETETPPMMFALMKAGERTERPETVEKTIRAQMFTFPKNADGSFSDFWSIDV